jgi:N6-L-threonylcarbamoyladenine synthase
MYVLGIETSCDETSCAVVHNGNVLSNVTISSLKQHIPFGGVVPEVATRAHLKNIDKVLQAALERSKISLKQIDLIAVTHEPGLIGALVVGLSFAKALSLALNKPILGVNHLHAHMFAPFLNRPRDIKFPFLGVVVSGGHTDFYLVKDFNKIKLVGSTQDDACGEAYDKLARAFGLGYPGGPIIDKLFNVAEKNAFKFNCGRRDFDLSFSGIKTALVYKKQELERTGKFNEVVCRQLLSSFQHTAVESIVAVAIDAARKYKVKTIAAGGGVVANRHLRARLNEYTQEFNIFLPPIEYAADNAAMVAGLGFYLYNSAGLTSKITLQVRAN